MGSHLNGCPVRNGADSLIRVPVLCLGEALVDLVCERPVDDLAEADVLVPHCGGAIANAAIAAARCGARVALAGGVGDDSWGRWLERRLLAERVDLRFFRRVPGVATPIAFVWVDADGRPEFLVHGHGIEAGMASFRARLGEAMEESDALLLGSNTLVGEAERELSLEACRLARRAGKPIVFDVNLRPHRWSGSQFALELVREVCKGTLLVKANLDEASWVSGSSDPERAAERLLALGCEAAVVTLGADGALLRGGASADVAGVAANVVDTTGAGDVLTGVLVAALERSAFDVSSLEEALRRAVEIAARSTEGWGAVDALSADIAQRT
jgi:sugar/nucleoside kinase (ribokinase family)